PRDVGDAPGDLDPGDGAVRVDLKLLPVVAVAGGELDRGAGLRPRGLQAELVDDKEGSVEGDPLGRPPVARRKLGRGAGLRANRRAQKALAGVRVLVPAMGRGGGL